MLDFRSFLRSEITGREGLVVAGICLIGSLLVGFEIR